MRIERLFTSGSAPSPRRCFAAKPVSADEAPLVRRVIDLAAIEDAVAYAFVMTTVLLTAASRPSMCDCDLASGRPRSVSTRGAPTRPGARSEWPHDGRAFARLICASGGVESPAMRPCAGRPSDSRRRRAAPTNGGAVRDASTSTRSASASAPMTPAHRGHARRCGGSRVAITVTIGEGAGEVTMHFWSVAHTRESLGDQFNREEI
jgi:hypothetical protein